MKGTEPLSFPFRTLTGNRFQLWWLGLAGLLLGFLLVAPFALFQRLNTPQVADYEGTSLEGAAADFTLTNQIGKSLSLSDLRGQVVVLTFFDSQCEETCPPTAAELRNAYRALGRRGESVAFVGVNVNVEANTVADVAATTVEWQLDEIPSWHFLTGSREALDPVWQAYNIGVTPASDDDEELVHTPGVYIIDQEGQKRWYISTPFVAVGNPLITAPLSELLVSHIHDLLEK